MTTMRILIIIVMAISNRYEIILLMIFTLVIASIVAIIDTTY